MVPIRSRWLQEKSDATGAALRNASKAVRVEEMLAGKEALLSPKMVGLKMFLTKIVWDL